MPGKLTVISIFCGTGGSSLGYKWAGFKELLAIDFDKHAVECFKLNFKEVPIWHRSICDITSDDILKFCKIKKGELDVLDGSPPCQGFSTAGKRKVTDKRNDLFKEYKRLIEGLEPKVFIMENVSGMAKGKMKGKFIEIIKELKSLPYRVKVKQMNAKYYRVPQSRERIIFIGVRNDLKLNPVFPIATKFCKNDILEIIPDILFSKGDNRSGWTPYHKGLVTITKTEFSNGFIKCRSGIRNLTINEVKRFCTFPDSWKLTGKKSKQWARLGNAVMPKFMQAIAETIKKEILERDNITKKNKPSRKLKKRSRRSH